MSWILASVLFLLPLAANQLVTLANTDQVEKLGDFSCILEQFPTETNAAGQTSICGSE